METNNRKNHLIKLFQAITLYGLNDENLAKDIENFFIEILDNKDCESIFNDTLLYKFLLILKQQDQLSFVISFLIKELELKSLRLEYTKLEKVEQCQNIKNENGNLSTPEKLPRIKDSKLWPEEGKTAIVKLMETTEDGQKEKESTYEIDSQGQALRLVSRYLRPISDSALNETILNRSPLSELKEKYKKEDEITENDLQ